MTVPTIARDVDQYLTAPSVEVPRWEYAILRFEREYVNYRVINRQINEMGQCGWELVNRPLMQTDLPQTYPTPPLFLTFIFKRRTA